MVRTADIPHFTSYRLETTATVLINCILGYKNKEIETLVVGTFWLTEND